MNRYFIYIFLISLLTLQVQSATDQVKVWLELDLLQKNIDQMVDRYNYLESELLQDTNLILQQTIDQADKLTQVDAYTAYRMYHAIKKLHTIAQLKSEEIAAVRDKFIQLGHYIDLQYKELSDMRRKHLQFP